MELESIPAHFCALTDGVLDSEEHILLFLEIDNGSKPMGFSLSLNDGRALLNALTVLLPQAEQIQKQLLERN